jgi:2-desacetyl-2-hydroxyethyl bacteriochlorophyllide A dehydrogenase
MRAIRVLEPNVMEVKEVPAPVMNEGEVRIRIERAGICGSDMAIIQGQNPFAKYPVIPGHEFSGRIAETGKSSSFRVGDIVTARPVLTCGKCKACLRGDQNHCAQLKVLGVHQEGGYAEEIVLPEEVVKKVPAGMDVELAALAEPTAVAVHCNRRGHIAAGKSVAVIGAGVIGNLIFQVARAKGAERILAIDRVQQRLPLALETGADWAINSAEVDPVQFTREKIGEGFDIVFDLVGIEATMEQSIQMTRPGGSIVMIAIPHHKMVTFNYQDVFRKELELIGTRLYNDADFNEAIQLIAAGSINGARIITHRLPLDEGIRAIEIMRTQPDVAFKVMLES